MKRKTSKDCHVSANVGELMAAAFAAEGISIMVQGCRFPCATDYLAATGATFPDVPLERLQAFNRATLHEDMTEEDEEARYMKISRFFDEGAR
ncbi:MAG: hypothetical protein J6V72_02620 [Kiritimatiellae bacterium]|nr:hypothetical protein [Kiritimatiellia bacterium]